MALSQNCAKNQKIIPSARAPGRPAGRPTQRTGAICVGPANRGHLLGPSEPGPFAWAQPTKFFCVKGPRVAYLPPTTNFFRFFAPAGQGPGDGSWPPTTIFFGGFAPAGQGPRVASWPPTTKFLCLRAGQAIAQQQNVCLCLHTHVCITCTYTSYIYMAHTHTHTHPHTNTHTN